MLDFFSLFDAPDRDPRGRTITAVFSGRVEKKEVRPMAGSDAAEVRWFDPKNLPETAFDHKVIIEEFTRMEQEKRFVD